MYKIEFGEKASKIFKKLDKSTQEGLGKKIEALKSNPELGKPLTGKLAGLWSLRSGDYRAIYQIRYGELLVLVIKVGHRKNVYDDF